MATIARSARNPAVAFSVAAAGGVAFGLASTYQQEAPRAEGTETEPARAWYQGILDIFGGGGGSSATTEKADLFPHALENPKVVVSSSKDLNGEVAARYGAALIQKAIKENGHANVILATGASQFEMLENLLKVEGIDWSKVTCFHLDEYVGVTNQHPASFQKYLKERFAEQLAVPLAAFHYVEGGGDPLDECKRLNALIAQYPIDVAFIGIGENGHLAFNDPPCNMETTDPYIVVTLDEACRKQQMGEGWFATFDDVPKQAISMSMNHILKSKALVSTVPDARKADAVANTLKGEMTVDVPASFLLGHANSTLFLDKAAASKLD